MIKYTSQRLTKALGLIACMAISGLADAQAQDFNWAPAGPVYNAGRSRNLLVDRADPNHNVMYVGSTSSGVFTSTNGGVNWMPIDDQGTVRNISYLAQDLSNNILVATGEGFLRPGQKAKAQVGTGLYILNKTTNKLDPHSPSSQTGTVITRVACSPTDGNVVAIASNKGILLSSDGGINFSPALNVTVATNASGQDVKFDNNGVLYCSIGNEKTAGSSPSTKVYKSSGAVTAGNILTNSFNDITPPQGVLPDAIYGRIELAIAPSNNNVVYVSIANKATDPVGISSSMKAIFVSYDAGSSWGLLLQGSPQLDPLSDGATTASGDYAHIITVNPTNPNQLLIGGYLFYVYTRTSGTNSNPIGTWQTVGSPFALNTPYYLHENIHDIKIVGSGSTAKFYFVTDAGIFRSSDLATASAGTTPPSFQPFYQGLVTGQFNSVSIERYPTSTNAATATAGESIQANDGYIGGTGGNGLTYFSGNYPQAAQETSYLGGEIYNAEYSKILPNAIFATSSDGSLYRSSDIRSATPGLLSVNSYSGSLSAITPLSNDFANQAASLSGTAFKLWENYGQVMPSPDSVIFYNDSIRRLASINIGGVASLTTQTTFTFSVGRPNDYALIDSIAIRTGTVIYDANSSKVDKPFQGADKKDIFIKLPTIYPTTSTLTIPSIASMVGPVSAAGVTLDAVSGLDLISVTFSAPAFGTKTAATAPGSSDPSVYYKVFATVFYKYKAGDSITVTDNSISTHSVKYDYKLQVPLRWSNTSLNGSKPFSAPTNPIQKIPAQLSARLAMVYSSGANGPVGTQTDIVVCKSPLNLNDPLSLVRIGGTGALTTDANGVTTNSTITVSGVPNLLQWSRGGTELYFATSDNKLYRISNIFTIIDYTPANYSGKITTDIFKYNSAAPTSPMNTASLNPTSPYRTTLIGSFTRPITSINVAKNDSSLMLTFNPQGSDTMVFYSSNNVKKGDYSNITFSSKKGAGISPTLTIYCSLMEKDDNKQVFLGTDNGIFYTSDITASSPNWSNVNNNELPNVQVFDIKQQTLEPWNCYNSGEIYVATNGRGVWNSQKYLSSNVVSVQELEQPVKANSLSLYPNPTNGSVYVNFSSVGGENATLMVMDINGRLVKNQPMGKLFNGQTTYVFETSDLSAGMYIVNINSDAGIKRVAKLVVSK